MGGVTVDDIDTIVVPDSWDLKTGETSFEKRLMELLARSPHIKVLTRTEANRDFAATQKDPLADGPKKFQGLGPDIRDRPGEGLDDHGDGLEGTFDDVCDSGTHQGADHLA